MPDRRFDEAEIAEIFRQAAEAQTDARNRANSSHGLTLAELQEVGKEAGLSPEFVAQAALRLGGGTPETERPTFMGIPIGVAHDVDLPGPMSDDEWDRLVVDLRRTFAARGNVRQSGGLREWYNGNLHALVEPTDTGHRLKLGTLKGTARDFIASGVGMILMALLGAAILFTLDSSVTIKEMMALVVVAAAGAGLAGTSILRLSPWAAERERQMVEIGERTRERMLEGDRTPERERETRIELDEDMVADPSPASARDRTRT